MEVCWCSSLPKAHLTQQWLEQRKGPSLGGLFRRQSEKGWFWNKSGACLGEKEASSLPEGFKVLWTSVRLCLQKTPARPREAMSTDHCFWRGVCVREIGSVKWRIINTTEITPEENNFFKSLKLSKSRGEERKLISIRCICGFKCHYMAVQPAFNKQESSSVISKRSFKSESLSPGLNGTPSTILILKPGGTNYRFLTSIRWVSCKNITSGQSLRRPELTHLHFTQTLRPWALRIKICRACAIIQKKGKNRGCKVYWELWPKKKSREMLREANL